MKIVLRWESYYFRVGNNINGSQLWSNSYERINDEAKWWYFSKIRRDIFIAQWKDGIVINVTNLGKYYENKT